MDKFCANDYCVFHVDCPPNADKFYVAVDANKGKKSYVNLASPLDKELVSISATRVTFSKQHNDWHLCSFCAAAVTTLQPDLLKS